MGKCESATASIGIKVLLSDLILQINETNLTLIKEMLYNGFIEDENNYFNNIYSNILNRNDLSKNYTEFKEQLAKYFKLNDSSIGSGCLFDKYLLVPIKQILKTDRWGYDRSGLNGVSRQIDFDLCVNIEEYKGIEKQEIVFILGQHSD
jgi:hypothetical protein